LDGRKQHLLIGEVIANAFPRNRIMNESVLAAVVNYDFSDNADALKAGLSPHFETVLIDNSSPTPPKTVDLVVPNEYYAGQWNASVRVALERGKDWLMFIASDVQIPDPDLLAKCVDEVTDDPIVGMYTPSLKKRSRLAYPICFNRGTGKIRECFVVETFFFLAQMDLLELLYPAPVEVVSYGWGIGIRICYHAYETQRKAVVDDRVEIFHPKSIHITDHTEPLKQYCQYVPVEARRFFRQSKRKMARDERFQRPWYQLKSLFSGR
jgi:hypothetical protein